MSVLGYRLESLDSTAKSNSIYVGTSVGRLTAAMLMGMTNISRCQSSVPEPMEGANSLSTCPTCTFFVRLSLMCTAAPVVSRARVWEDVIFQRLLFSKALAEVRGGLTKKSVARIKNIGVARLGVVVVTSPV